MENTNTYFECEIDNLHYITVERAILKYFNMGLQDNSNIPPKLPEDSSDEYILTGTKKSGSFDICNYKQADGKYLLQVNLIGRLHMV